MPQSANLKPAGLPQQLTLEQAVPTLAQLKASLAQQPGPEVVLEGSELRELDTSAVAVLLELRRVLQQQGKSLKVLHGPQRLRDLVALYGVSELLST